MPISTDERRFLKNWEEQRKDGKGIFVATYTFGFFFMFYLGFVVLGLFSGLPFIKMKWLVSIAILSLALAFFVSMILWKKQQKKFAAIIKRELTILQKEQSP